MQRHLKFLERGIFEKGGGVDLERGVYNPPYHLWVFSCLQEGQKGTLRRKGLMENRQSKTKHNFQ